MADFDPKKVIEVLTTNKTSLGADDSIRDKVLAEASARLGGRSSDDKKEASKLAVEAAKQFITIGTAVLVAVGVFVQFARNAGIPWDSLVIYLFAASALFGVSSIVSGFIGISSIYKRADGRTGSSLPAWSTEAVKHQLNWQGLLGILGLLALVGGLIYWGITAPRSAGAFGLKTPDLSAQIVSAGPLSIKGDWTTLKLTTAAGQELILPAKSQPTELTCR